MESSFLIKKGQTWYARKMVPVANRKLLGKTKYVVSLKTRDKAEANRRKHDALAAIERQMAADLAARSSSPDSARALLELARREREAIQRGELSRREAESAFEVAVSDFLEAEAQKHGIDEHTGHPLTEEADVRVVRAAHAVMSGEEVTLFDDAVQTYLAEIAPTIRAQTLQEKRRHLEKLSKWLGPAADVASINRKRAGQYVTNVLVREGKAPKTTRDEIGHLSAFFSWLERRGEVESNPFFRVSGSVRESTLGTRAKRRAWTAQELTAVLQGIPTVDPLWSLVAIAAYTGMRREEICQLRVEDVGEHLNITQGKTKAAVRAVPIHPTLRPLLESLKANSPDGFVIPGLLTGGADDKRGHYVGKRFTELRRAAGVTDEAVNFHTLRNSFANRMEEAGVPETTAALIVGHQRSGMTYGRYSQMLSSGALSEAVEKVTYGERLDSLVRNTGAQAAITSRSRRRG